jgi:uncharacterized protein YkuJ
MKMFELKLVVNKDKYNKANIKMTADELNEFKEILISVNPFYDWLEENINIISYKLLKGFISNIIPLGDEGRKYFEVIAEEKTGFTNELMNLYDRLEKMYHKGNLKVKSYFELAYLGYTGTFLGEKYPVDDVIKYL